MATRLIGIVGGTCSGKTSVAAELGYPVISQESWYISLTNSEKKSISDINWDHPSRINFDRYIETLINLKSGNNVNIPVYNYKTHSQDGYSLIRNNCGTIVVEGIFVGYTKEERDLFDAIFFVDVPADERLIRRLRRKRSTRTTEETMIQWERFIQPGHNQFIEPLKKYANVIIPHGVKNIIAMSMLKEWLNK